MLVHVLCTGWSFQVPTPLRFPAISPGAMCVVSSVLCFLHLMHEFSQTHADTPHSCRLCRYITIMLYLLLIGADSRRLKGTTLLFSYKKFVRFCLLTYSPYQLIETVKRVSLRVLVTQRYPDACQHCHVIWLVSARAAGLFPFQRKSKAGNERSWTHTA